MPTQLSPRRQFQILFGLCLGVFPAAVLGLTMTQSPPKPSDSTTSADVAAGFGTLITVGALAAAVLLVWAEHAWLPARLAGVIVIAALLGACVLLTATLTGSGWQFPLLYLIAGLGFILAGLISTIATDQR